jgi:hypothetical protein
MVVEPGTSYGRAADKMMREADRVVREANSEFLKGAMILSLICLCSA